MSRDELPGIYDTHGRLLFEFAHARTPGVLPMLAFVQCIERGITPDPDTLRWAMLAFKLILAGEDPRTALLLDPGRGRLPAPALLARDWQHALLVDALRMHGMSREAAAGTVAHVKAVDQAQVETGYARFAELLRALPEIAEQFRVEHWELIEQLTRHAPVQPSGTN